MAACGFHRVDPYTRMSPHGRASAKQTRPTAVGGRRHHVTLSSRVACNLCSSSRVPIYGTPRGRARVARTDDVCHDGGESWSDWRRLQMRVTCVAPPKFRYARLRGRSQRPRMRQLLGKGLMPHCGAEVRDGAMVRDAPCSGPGTPRRGEGLPE